MVPEQLEGQEADARTDIFALGSLLYEMATGERAFSGKDADVADRGERVGEAAPGERARADDAARLRARRASLPGEGAGRALAVGPRRRRAPALDRGGGLAGRRAAWSHSLRPPATAGA